MKPSASKVATAAPSSSSATVKYELLSFRSTQPQQPVRFEFGPLKETFTLELPTDPNDGTTRQQTWREWKKRAIEHPTVKQYFKSSATLHFGEFAVRLPGGSSGEWIGPESLRDSEEADTKHLLKIAGASNTTSSILLLYAPSIHICTFDGIKFSACSFGHWLSASDTKTLERIKKAAGDEGLCPNDWLLKENQQSDLARVLFRVALFLNEELKLEPDSYIISVPFGQYLFADGDDLGREEVRARVQLTDVRIFWTLLLKFEEKLLDDDQAKRLDYFVHQRQAWIDARTTDYKRWASQEASSVRVALENPAPAPTTPFKLPKNCSWDEYGRMQLCLKMFSPLCEMVGQMGSISMKLKAVVAAVQMAAVLTGTSILNAPVSINVSTRSDQCFVLLPADRYMSVLTRASADPKTWGAALLDALRDAPDRLYSGLLFETSGLYQCSRDDIAKIDECLKSLAPKLPGFKGIAKVVDTSVLPMSADVIKSLESKNHTDKRLFLERALEQKAFSGVVLSVLSPADRPTQATVHQPTVWEKKRASAVPPVLSGVPMRDSVPVLSSMPDREDMQMRHQSSQNEDFARFEAVQASNKSFSGPTPAQAVAHSKSTPALPILPKVGNPNIISRPQPSSTAPSATSGFTQPGYRQPPPTVGGFGTEKPSQPASRPGPPKVQLDEPLVSGIKPPPPQVKAGPPTVFGARAATAAEPTVTNGTFTQRTGANAFPASRADDKPKPMTTPQQDFPEHTQRKEFQSHAIRHPESQLLDREDRGFEALNGPSNGQYHGNRSFRGRGRGGGRGGFIGRGGRGGNNQNDSGNPVEHPADPIH